MSKSLLIIAHAPSANTAALAHAALRGATHPDAGQITAQLASPFEVTADDLSTHDGIIIGTMENIGYMAGATKDLFDRCYDDWMDRHQGLPVGLYIRAGRDGTATRRALETIIGALRWRLVAEPLILHGDWQDSYCDDVAELSMGMAAGMDAGIF